MPLTVAWANKILQSTMRLRLLAAVDGAGGANHFRPIHHFSDIEGGVELVVDAVYLLARPVQGAQCAFEIFERSHFLADCLGIGNSACAAHGFEQHACAIIKS